MSISWDLIGTASASNTGGIDTITLTGDITAGDLILLLYGFNETGGSAISPPSPYSLDQYFYLVDGHGTLYKESTVKGYEDGGGGYTGPWVGCSCGLATANINSGSNLSIYTTRNASVGQTKKITRAYQLYRIRGHLVNDGEIANNIRRVNSTMLPPYGHAGEFPFIIYGHSGPYNPGNLTGSNESGCVYRDPLYDDPSPYGWTYPCIMGGDSITYAQFANPSATVGPKGLSIVLFRWCALVADSLSSPDGNWETHLLNTNYGEYLDETTPGGSGDHLKDMGFCVALRYLDAGAELTGPVSFNTNISTTQTPNYGVRWAGFGLFIPELSVGGVDHLRHPLLDQRFVFYCSNGQVKCDRMSDSENDTSSLTTTIDSGANNCSPKASVTDDGTLWVGYMQGTSFVFRQSYDYGVTWSVPTTIGTGYTQGELFWVSAWGSIKFPIAMLYASNKWYVKVGIVNDNDTITWSSAVDIGVNASDVQGRLIQRQDGVLEFMYVDNAGVNKAVRCESLGVNGSGTWS